MRPQVLRLTLCVTLIFAGLFVALPANLSADEGPGSEAAQAAPGLLSEEEASLAAYIQVNPQAAAVTTDYYWTAGSNFQPRHSWTEMDYYGGGCVYRTNTSGTNDGDAFTAPLTLPDGAVILGMRFYGYDNNAGANSSLNIFGYTGDGGNQDKLQVSSSGTPGFFSAYVALPTPVSVDNYAESLSLVWYSHGMGNALQLCGARVLYTRPLVPAAFAPPQAPAPPAAAPADDVRSPDSANVYYRYSWLTAQDFQPRYSSAAYSYDGGGCMSSPSGGMFLIDANLPEGATLLGVRVYYNDTSPTSGLSFYASTYDGGGGIADPLIFNIGATAGYGSQYTSLTTPYLVNQYNESLVLQVQLPVDPLVRLCGARMLYSLPSYPTPSPAAATSAQPEAYAVPDAQGALAPQAAGAVYTRYRFIPGTAFQPRNANTTYSYDSGGCVHLAAGTPILTHDLHLPSGARLYGVRLFYYDTSANESKMFVEEYDGTGWYDQFITQPALATQAMEAICDCRRYLYRRQRAWAQPGMGLRWRNHQ